MARFKPLQGDASHEVALAQARIESAVAALQSGSDWQAYLRLQSCLYAYSVNNVWLICGQPVAAFEQGVFDTPWPTAARTLDLPTCSAANRCHV